MDKRTRIRLINHLQKSSFPKDERDKIQLVMFKSIELAAWDMRKAAHLSPDFKEYLNREKIQSINPWYDGGSLIGGYILGMCVISHVSKLHIKDDDRTAFIWLVDKYLKKPYRGIELYSLRNSLIKEYATKCRLINAEGKPIVYILYGGIPSRHQLRTSSIVILNFENFAKEVYEVVVNFFIDVLKGKLPRETVDNIIEHSDRLHKLEEST